MMIMTYPNAIVDLVEATVREIDLDREFYDSLPLDRVRFEQQPCECMQCVSNAYLSKERILEARTAYSIYDYIAGEVRACLKKLSAEVAALPEPVLLSNGRCGYDSIVGRIEWESCIDRAVHRDESDPNTAILVLSFLYRQPPAA
jgi:hypothetical protein